MFNSNKLAILLKNKERFFVLSICSLCILFFSSLSLAIPNYDQVSKGFREILKTTPLFFTSTNSGLNLPVIAPNRGLELESPYIEPQGSFLLDLDNGSNPSYLEGNGEINLCYLYEDQDINTLLRLRAEEERLDLNANILLPPLEDNIDQLEVQFREERERYLARVSNGDTPHPINILFPLNIPQLNHWIGVVISLDAHNQLVQVGYIDSLSYSCREDSEYSKKMKEVLQRLQEALKRTYGNNISIGSLQGLLQIDNAGCGPLTVENLIRAARGFTGSEVVSRELIQAIREQHVRLAERYEPELKLRKRQKNNLRSFEYSSKETSSRIILSSPIDPAICQSLGLTPAICGGGNKPGKIRIDRAEGSYYDNYMFQGLDVPYIPEEIQSEILGYLEPKELSAVAMVSKQWRRIADDNILWGRNVVTKFPNKIIAEAVAIDKNVLGENDETYAGHKQNAKHIYRICGLLLFLKKDDIITILDAEKGERDEVSSYTTYNDGNILAQALAEALKISNNKVTDLILKNGNIDDIGVQAIVTALKNPNCKVTHLNLGGNKINDAGVQALANVLRHPNCKVTILNLWGNKIGDAGVGALAEVLKDPNCKVTQLGLGGNQINYAGTQALAKALRHPNCKVTKLNLWGSKIGDAGVQAIATALKYPKCKVTYLNLSNIRIHDAVAQYIAEVLKDPNCKVTQLILRCNQIYDAGAQAIAEVLREPSCKVTKLNLSDNQIGYAGAEALAEALVSVRRLQNREINIIGVADFERLLEQAEQDFE